MYLKIALIAVTLSLPGLAYADEARPLKTQKERIDYSVGIDLVRNFKRQAMDVDLETVIRGMRDASGAGKLQMSDAEMRRILADYQQELKTKQAQLKQELAEKNRKDGEKFLAENKKKAGVVTTASGLQYTINKAGKGKSPVDTSAVTVKYRGTLLDGTEFDSSDRIGYPLTFYVKDSIIAGWAEALKLMQAGSSWKVYVPHQLAYGEKGAGRDIGPNATLVYEIELIAVDPQVSTIELKKDDKKGDKKKTEKQKDGVK